MHDPTKRPYKDKSITELANLFNTKCLAAKQLGNAGAVAQFEEEGSLPSSFLKDGASDAAIEELQKKIRAEPYNFSDGLAEDYVEFLKFSNGIYASEPDGQDEIFCSVETAELIEGFMPLELLPSLLSLVDKVDYPQPEWGLQIGAGGDEGTHCFYPPHAVKASIDALDKYYKKAKKEQKREIEKAAKDLYGGMDQLRKTRSLVFRMYHWAAEVEIFPTFKHLLEDFVVQMDEKEEKDQNEGKDEDGNEPNSKTEKDGDTANKSGSNSKPTTTTNNRKSIPSGKPNSLSNLKLLFTGTFNSMDRSTSKATTQKYGGRIVSKLEDADYIVLGTQIGPKKLETIKAKSLPTIDEDGFLVLLQGNDPAKANEKLNDISTKAMPPTNENGARKQTAQGKPNSLKGLKIMFTGTLETMDRATSKKTAEKFGAKVVSKLDGTDFIVLGTSAGPKKLEEIEKKGLRTVTEKEFQEMLESGEDADSGQGQGMVSRGENDDEGGEGSGEQEEAQEKVKTKAKGKKRGTPTPGTRSSKRTKKS